MRLVSDDVLLQLRRPVLGAVTIDCIESPITTGVPA
jgi:hypothetical protein